MSRARPALLATLTALILTLAAPLDTLAAAHAKAHVTHAARHHGRASRQLHAAGREGHAVRSRPASATAHRSHEPRGASRSEAVAGPHGTAASDRTAAIAAVLATTCQNTELTPTSRNIELVRAAVLCLINRERAQNGEPPLTLNAELQQAAQDHSDELVSADYFDHVSPSGVTPVDRIRSTGYIPDPNAGYVIGENLAWGTINLATPESIVNAWIASPGHLANILEAQYADTGIGVTPQVPASMSGGQPGATYAQEFGVIIG